MAQSFYEWQMAHAERHGHAARRGRLRQKWQSISLSTNFRIFALRSERVRRSFERLGSAIAEVSLAAGMAGQSISVVAYSQREAEEQLEAEMVRKLTGDVEP